MELRNYKYAERRQEPAPGIKFLGDAELDHIDQPYVFILAAFKTTGKAAFNILQFGSKLRPTPSRTVMAISSLANLDSSFT